MTIYEQIKTILAGREGDIVTATAVKKRVVEAFQTNPASIILSDYCYNRFNNGIAFTKHLFIYLDRNTYKYVGENDAYTGLIYQKKRGAQETEVVGEWKRGEVFFYHGMQKNLTTSSVQAMYEHYSEILQFEMNVLGCQATELRHLTGRIGEFVCVLETGGELAATTNQPGYDVVANGRRISVKTTAQTTGFIRVNQKTFHLFDDLFIVQFNNGNFNVLFYGDKELAPKRVYGDTYEIDLTKLKKSCDA